MGRLDPGHKGCMKKEKELFPRVMATEYGKQRGTKREGEGTGSVWSRVRPPSCLVTAPQARS